MELLADRLHKQNNVQTGFRVQITGRLIGKDDCGLGRKRAGNRYTLLLTAGEIVRHIFELLFQSKSMDDLPEVPTTATNSPSSTEIDTPSKA